MRPGTLRKGWGGKQCTNTKGISPCFQPPQPSFTYSESQRSLVILAYEEKARDSGKMLKGCVWKQIPEKTLGKNKTPLRHMT